MRSHLRVALCAALTALVIAGSVLLIAPGSTSSRTHIVAYFDNSNGIFPGDDVVLLGVPVGSISRIEPQPDRVKIEFWVDERYPIPAAASAVILSPQLITSRAIQLTPAYTGGPKMTDNSIIDLDRTAVPVEWDDFRDQLERLTHYLQPSEPGGMSPLGSLVDTAANNLSGQGPHIRETLIELSGALSALGDHSGDVFSTIRNLSTLVSALRSSTDLMAQLNGNLASVTELLANDPREVARAIDDVHTAAGDVTAFLTEQQDAVGTAADKLTSVSTAVVEQLDEIEQILHVGPTTLQNVINVYEPAHASLTGAAVVNHFADPISFLCGAVQAASRMGFEQSAKLCVQYLAPIIKNRQYNFPPIGLNPIVGATARPNEVTYSEDWLRPGHIPASTAAPAQPEAPWTADAAVSTDPADGLAGMLVPSGGGR